MKRLIFITLVLSLVLSAYAQQDEDHLAEVPSWDLTVDFEVLPSGG